MADPSLEERLAAEIEARKRAEELLREEREVYEHSPGLFCSLRASTFEILKCNERFSSALELKMDEAIGRSVLDIVAPSERGPFQALLETTEGGNTWTSGEIKCRTATGTFLASVKASWLANTHDDARIHLILQDITGPRLSLVSPGESQERWESLFRASPDFLCLVDREHKIELINRVEESWKFKDVIGAPINLFSHPEGREEIRVNLERVFKHRETRQWDSTYPRADGSVRYFNTVASPVVVADVVTQSVVALRDISEQVRLQKEMNELEEQIRQTQKMEAVGRLAGGVAHDFNNILTAIMGYSSIAQRQLAEDDPNRFWADEVSIAASRAADLTKQLLAFSRRQVVAPKVINLGELTQNLVPMLCRLIGETINLRTEHSKCQEAVLIDPIQAEQILLNLVINARDAMEQGGEVFVETSLAVLGEDYCKTFSNAKPGKHVVLAVSDTGSGMTAEVRDRVFEPFFTTKERGQGTGLGLATVFGIVEQASRRVD